MLAKYGVLATIFSAGERLESDSPEKDIIFRTFSPRGVKSSPYTISSGVNGKIIPFQPPPTVFVLPGMSIESEILWSARLKLAGASKG